MNAETLPVRRLPHNNYAMRKDGIRFFAMPIYKMTPVGFGFYNPQVPNT